MQQYHLGEFTIVVTGIKPGMHRYTITHEATKQVKMDCAVPASMNPRATLRETLESIAETKPAADNIYGMTPTMLELNTKVWVAAVAALA